MCSCHCSELNPGRKRKTGRMGWARAWRSANTPSEGRSAPAAPCPAQQAGGVERTAPSLALFLGTPQLGSDQRLNTQELPRPGPACLHPRTEGLGEERGCLLWGLASWQLVGPGQSDVESVPAEFSVDRRPALVEPRLPETEQTSKHTWSRDARDARNWAFH